jgi:hypothetical protein
MEYGTACLAIEIHRKLKFPVTKRFAVLSWKVQAIFGATVSKPQHEMARIGSVRVKQCMRGGVGFSRRHQLVPDEGELPQSGDSACACELECDEGRAMSAYETNGERIAIQTDSYERRASQEEFYLEETEEELRMILECDETTSQSSELSPGFREESEDLLTGDLDDPPLSEDPVEDALRRF